MAVLRPEVRGIDVDAATRCTHYHPERDVIAIRMTCCGIYYACKDCHEALADHPATVWPQQQWDTRAVLCGICGHELSIREYLDSGYQCPRCNAAFNPGCCNHHNFYFAATETL